jgi:hypothetical protein
MVVEKANNASLYMQSKLNYFFNSQTNKATPAACTLPP